MIAGYKMNKRIGDVEEFAFDPLLETNDLHVTIAVTGWLTEEEPGEIDCSKHIEAETKWPPFCRRIFKSISLNENVWILMKISLKFVTKGPICNNPP